MVTDTPDPTEIPFVVIDGGGRRSGGRPSPDADGDLGEMGAAALVAMVAQAARLIAIPWKVAGTAATHFSQTPVGQAMGESLRVALEEPAGEGRQEMEQATQWAGEQLAKVINALAPALLEAVDIDAVLEHLDLDAALARIDVNALLARVDVGALLDRVDVDTLKDRIRAGESGEPA